MVTDGSEVDSSFPLPAKRQKCSANIDTLPVQKTVDTKETACSISGRTLEKIKTFSAFHGLNDEQMEFDGTSRRQNVESRKRMNEINLFNTQDSKQDSVVLSDKGEDNKQAVDVLSLRYSEIT
jgi:hypothetical protein